MRTLTLASCWLALALFGAACKSQPTRLDAGHEPIDTGMPVDSGTIDAGTGEVDSGMIDAGATDSGLPMPSSSFGVETTAGSGETVSASHRLRLNVSSPQPIGSTSSAGYRVVLGPRAPR